jgi:serine/threonine-protein kinase
VAVLPFLNLSPDRENEYFSDGMAEELTNALARVSGLRVASRTSCFAFKGKNADAREIAERLKVRSLVEGSVRKVGNRIRITVQLVNAADGYQLWSATYDRTLADVFALQEEISQAIVHALPLRASGPIRLVKPGTAVLDAYPLYLRGRYFALKRTIEGLHAGVEYFEQALERDPGYALAHAGLGECWALLGFEEFGDVAPRVAMPRAAAAVRRALELDPRLAEGHNWRGVIALLYEYDWAAAESAFLSAVELRPAYSLAHTWYAVFLSAMGRADEAIQRVSLAAELDPVAISIQSALGFLHAFAGRYEEAIRWLRATIELDPGSARVWVWLARSYRGAGRGADSLATAEEAIRRFGRLPITLGDAGLALAHLGRAEEARRVLEELEALRARCYVSPGFIAPIYAALGQIDEAFRLCDLMIEERAGHAAFLAVLPGWARLRGEPRFAAILRRLRLPAGL